MDAQAKMISISKVSSYLWAIQHVFLVIAHRVISFLLDAVSDCRLSIQRFGFFLLLALYKNQGLIISVNRPDLCV